MIKLVANHNLISLGSRSPNLCGSYKHKCTLHAPRNTGNTTVEGALCRNKGKCLTDAMCEIFVIESLSGTIRSGNKPNMLPFINTSLNYPFAFYNAFNKT